MFEVLDGGLYTTVQDLGRPGFLSVGIPPSGAQDSASLRLGNLLVGNGIGDRFLIGKDPGKAGLEITLFGPKLKVLRESVVAITGGDLSATLNEEPFPMWTSIRVKKGNVIAFGEPRAGARAYLCVAGGIDAPSFLGSRSTFTRGGFGGIGGRRLETGDILRFGKISISSTALEGRTLNRGIIPRYRDPWNVRILLGPQDHLLTDESIEEFLSSDWTLRPDSDRMGFRYEGPSLRFRPRPSYLIRQAGSEPSNIVDEAIPVGGVQVPGGKPIVMGVDGPSSGGYAKIATVISPDLSRVGQTKPGEITRFESISFEEAHRIIKELEEILRDPRILHHG